MKKFMLPILLFLMFIPFVANAEACDTDKITIENIAIESKSDNVEELSQATASGKNINLNLSMSEVGDSIEYRFVVKNDSNEDYELGKTSLNLNLDYINYSFETEDNSNIVKAKSSKNVTLRVEYKSEVPEDKFESGIYTDNKTMIVQLSNGNTINVPNTIKNPKTGAQSYILIILIILLISGSLYILLKKKKFAKFMILIVGTAIIIPISVYALCKCEIKVNSKVLVESSNKYVCKKAKTLHTKTCSFSNMYGCGVTIGSGNNITYGSLVNGSLKAGDAFDCKVTDDGDYTERFYYVGSDGENSTLIYYTNMNNNASYIYNSTGLTNQGPVTAYEALPSTREWNNSNLITPGTRQITDIFGSTIMDGEDLKNFTYTDKAARFLTIQELSSACGVNLNSYSGGYSINGVGELDNCNWALENTSFDTDGQQIGYYLENPNSLYYVFGVAGNDRFIYSFPNGAPNSVRPVITVKTDLLEK